jgi:hypothetical protein
MEVSIKFSKRVETELGQYSVKLEELKVDLIKYFQSDGRERPEYIGKDAPFIRPDTITDSEVHHLHIYIKGVSCITTWNKKNTSDSYLIYTYGDMNEEAYYVFGFIYDDAHDKCKLPKGNSLLTSFKIEADDFRNRN